MSSPTEILLKHWGHKQFRPLQKDIIQSVLDGKDTLALLPTGGGKSICYQVPGMMMDGLCIVISPLLALINDQIEGLRKKGILAETVNSQIWKKDIDRILDNCIYGNVKFLFIAPERLGSELFRERLKKMNVGLIAVDEAHCISQWGHDFRPAYRKIAEIREIQKAPVLALTATATSVVVDDIQEQLAFNKSNVLKMSFARENISFQVFDAEDKRGKLLELLRSEEKGAGIIYARNRRKCRELSCFIESEGMSCTHYHAGLSTEARKKAQGEWMDGTSRFVVATNAFGMGIDKSNVRIVVHYDLSDSIESYYQEAGRAGRDGESARAIQLYNLSDVEDSRRMLMKHHPSVETVKKIYQVMSDRLGLAAGSGELETYGLDIVTLAKQAKVNLMATMGSLKILQQNEYIQLHQGLTQPSTLLLTAERRQLMELQESENDFGRLLHAIVRSKTGLYTAPVTIREENFAKQVQLPVKTIETLLGRAAQNGILEYQKRAGTSSVIYMAARQHNRDLRLDTGLMKAQRKRVTDKQDSLIRYIQNEMDCRTMQILSYFNEDSDKKCGKCDVCTKATEADIEKRRLPFYHELRAELGSERPLTELKAAIGLHEPWKADLFRWCIDKGFVIVTEDQVSWSGPKLSPHSQEGK